MSVLVVRLVEHGDLLMRLTALHELINKRIDRYDSRRIAKNAPYTEGVAGSTSHSKTGDFLRLGVGDSLDWFLGTSGIALPGAMIFLCVHAVRLQQANNIRRPNK